MRHDDVQAVGGAALKNHDQPPVPAGSGHGSLGGAREKRGNRRRANHRERAIAKKNPARNGHDNLGYLL